MTEEFHDAQEYIADDKIKEFDINQKIIYKIDKSKFIIKLIAKELIQESDTWIYNRKINEQKVEELKKQIKNNDNSIGPIWNFSLIYDKYGSTDDYPKYLKILDGQHRWKAIYDLLFNSEINEEYEIYANCYVIKHCEGKNKNIATDLFKKINNNMPFNVEDIPDTRVQDIIDKIIEDNILNPNNEGIKIKNGQKTAHEPAIHKQELFHLFNKNKELFSDLTIDNIIANLKIIVNKISLKPCNDIYTKNDKNIKRFNKAKSVNFWLGLKSSDKYSPEKWILYINNTLNFGK
tara:strand:- start:3117 stop:3989 length:873 start_codon:yes stop_codon:yes gene_type:complete